MSYGRGRSLCDTGPRELRLDLIVLARLALPRDGTVGERRGPDRREDTRRWPALAPAA
jgi:hypothetical protein